MPHLVGWLRKDKDKTQLNLYMSAEAFDSAQRYRGHDDKEYVSLVVNLAKVQEIMDGKRDVVSICQIVKS